MEPMTRADVVAKVREHFSSPLAELAINDDTNNCVYRGEDDASSSLRCAFGAVLPDDRYDPKMEGKNAAGVIETYGLNGLFTPDVYQAVDMPWINELQGLHDELAQGDASVADFLTVLDEFETDTVPPCLTNYPT